MLCSRPLPRPLSPLIASNSLVLLLPSFLPSLSLSLSLSSARMKIRDSEVGREEDHVFFGVNDYRIMNSSYKCPKSKTVHGLCILCGTGGIHAGGKMCHHLDVT